MALHSTHHHCLAQNHSRSKYITVVNVRWCIGGSSDKLSHLKQTAQTLPALGNQKTSRRRVISI
ncbi:hypothetical protein M404DRAFT_1001204 [Pisolithus tinctorius Marx 270]|uniref:Uncharacterized protein n=1 Tax=Pisolithus tinctorius Marx 270 TaxID=870435 RepID=A0A0C3P7S4_PISTI|nr:hypothetical protein M404DRAFT_1001204 [Pisolithus tinctorius Marx 270]